ncbi:hypothetical protein MNBD_UNCLBAC01-1714 [hydrothermal vent metagenome]|uniref:Uncharacterized protein n=1 Tax=hydrothermal vent metagenome TaxID=652676 RepID=A0A3B1CX76_9ZZZZ
MKTLLLFLIILSVPSIVIAHPGHGLERELFSLLHYLIEPVHLAIGIALGSVIAIIFWLKKINSRKVWVSR